MSSVRQFRWYWDNTDTPWIPEYDNQWNYEKYIVDISQELDLQVQQLANNIQKYCVKPNRIIKWEHVMYTEPKQVIILRKDLNMRKGKMVAQGCHASMKAVIDHGKIIQTHPHEQDYALSIDITPDFYPALNEWLKGRFTKVCVSVDSEQELIDVYEQAKTAGLLCSIITDAGLTEFNGIPTKTAVAIGPAFPEQVDPITGHLKLL
jgi:PTH2 family peptidyl-tRNA hydrolase